VDLAVAVLETELTQDQLELPVKGLLVEAQLADLVGAVVELADRA
jgi:hypothetical protein